MDALHETLDKMILSASGWRGVFASCGDEEGKTAQISQVYKVICAAAALVFSSFLDSPEEIDERRILLGTDTRPTGKEIADIMFKALYASGCDVRYAGVVAAPEIMAWARKFDGDKTPTGFIYISASHNPIGHNGLKFGLTDGGVLSSKEAAELIEDFRAFLDSEGNIEGFAKTIEKLETVDFSDKNDIEAEKKEARKAYYDFCQEVVSGAVGNAGGGDVVDNDVADNGTDIFTAMKDGLKKRPLGVVCDFNGSARTVSIDKEFFSTLGLKFECINDKPGEIAHRIVPEGESLKPCWRLLEETRTKDSSFVLGYVPDCDGDRGNLVIWDETAGKTRALEAQEVFALACVAEFAHLAWTGELESGKVAVAINDPTSMRIDRIAHSFGISVFRAEVGEANVVGLARRLRKQGYIVRILGEGSAGGNITHPSAVRDPINTVFSIVKLLSIRSTASKLVSASRYGLFELWCKASGHPYNEDFSLADIISSLPKFISTPAYSEDAIMRIKTADHEVLKNNYEKIFLQGWEDRKKELKGNYGFCTWQAFAYNGIEEKRLLNNFGESGKGGLKISFLDKDENTVAYIWMRGSATEPVFRIMADIEDKDNQGRQIEQDLLAWQRSMILRADRIEV